MNKPEPESDDWRDLIAADTHLTKTVIDGHLRGAYMFAIDAEMVEAAQLIAAIAHAIFSDGGKELARVIEPYMMDSLKVKNELGN